MYLTDVRRINCQRAHYYPSPWEILRKPTFS